MAVANLYIFSTLFVIANLACSQAASTPSFANGPQKTPALTVYSGNLAVDQSYSREIPNMPAYWSQAGMPTCFGCASAVIVQKYICDIEGWALKFGRKCDAIPLSATVSQLSMIAWADTNKDRMNAGPDEQQTEGIPRNHRNLKLLDDTTAFSSGSNALSNAVVVFRFKPESCIPVAHLESTPKISAAFDASYRRARLAYTDIKRSPEGGDLEKLRSELTQLFGRTFHVEAIRRNIPKASFPEFLYELVFENCPDIKPMAFGVNPKFKQLPRGSEEVVAKADVFAAIKEVIDKGRPLMLNAVCLQYDQSRSRCVLKHSLVLSGYRRVCTLNTPSVCAIELKVHNCWGERWQRESNDGWMGAKELIDALNPGQPFITAGELSWLE